MAKLRTRFPATAVADAEKATDPNSLRLSALAAIEALTDDAAQVNILRALTAARAKWEVEYGVEVTI